MNQFPSDSPFEGRTLVEKAEYIKRNSIIALLLAILSFFICGFVGIFAVVLSRSVIEPSTIIIFAANDGAWRWPRRSSPLPRSCCGYWVY